jgi:hypothetical protein
VSTRHLGITTLEVWLIGTPHQVADAMTALASIGRIVQSSRPQRLHGTDTGRVRRYACVAVSTGRREVA